MGIELHSFDSMAKCTLLATNTIAYDGVIHVSDVVYSAVISSESLSQLRFFSVKQPSTVYT